MNDQLAIQGILGVDKKNPGFTINRQGKVLQVYLGMALLETVSDDNTKPAYKFLLGRLFNSGIKKKTIVKSFGICYTTIKRWGDAIKSENLKTIARVMAGPGAPLKMIKEIKAFIRIRFMEIYPQTKYGYSKTIRREIKSIFDKDISAETIRPIFSALKQELQNVPQSPCPETQSDPVQQATANSQDAARKLAPYCESIVVEGAPGQAKSLDIPGDTDEKIKKCNRKYALIFPKTGESLLCNHAGVLLFSPLINQLKNKVESHANLIVQWLMSILLGMVNIEQTKFIDPDSIKALLGTFIKSLKQQRIHLVKLAKEDIIANLLAFNMELVRCAQYTDFYYDPHTKHYTGMQKVLKGWCSGFKGVAKIINMDFIHTAAGDPVYIKNSDNFYDLRERFVDVIDEFREIMKSDKKDVQTFVFDRGIYGMDVFKGIVKKKYLHLITWEKGYRHNLWDEEKTGGSFRMIRARNNAHDLLVYEFSYIEQPWAKNNEMRQIIVRAINPNKVKIEVSILATDKERRAEEIVRLMFKRWIQENDFKYLIKHFGINEITSYSSTPYLKLMDLVKDKDITSGSYKAKELNYRDIKKELSKLLLLEHTKKKENIERQEKIRYLTTRLEKVKEEISQEKKKVSRLETLINEQYFRLNTNSKALLDTIKIIARNMFYQMLEPFKESYNNYRDDHALFRNITRSGAILIDSKEGITIMLIPTVSYEAKVRKTVDDFLDFVNLSNPVLPDGSNRKIIFKLGEKSSNLFAISNSHK